MQTKHRQCGGTFVQRVNNQEKPASAQILLYFLELTFYNAAKSLNASFYSNQKGDTHILPLRKEISPHQRKCCVKCVTNKDKNSSVWMKYDIQS